MPSRASAMQTEPDPARHLERLEREAVREPGRVGHAVVPQRQRHCRLDEADVSGPERDDRRDVHEHEHEPRGG